MENEFHAWLQARLPSDARLLVPVGDDAAVLDWSQSPQCVITTDMLADGVHFDLNDVGPEIAGRKSLAVNLSDVAAMAATPVAATVSLFLPRDSAAGLARRVVEGMLPLAREFDTVIAGGDTNVWDGPLVINVTMLALPHENGVLRRAGAVPGDVLLVSGDLGGSLAGHHLHFQPRIELARHLHTDFTLHAGMDVSDGLATDVRRLATQSHCGVEVQTAFLPISQMARELAAQRPERTAVERALRDGEDFELLLAVPLDTARAIAKDYRGDVPITEIGRFVAEPGTWLVDALGQRKECDMNGYEHA